MLFVSALCSASSMGGAALQAAMARLNSPVLDLLTAMLAFDPDERLTAAQALAHPWFQQARACPGPALAPANAVMHLEDCF